ncbi:MAG: amidohydrolase [Chloroflexi bacterium]|nr:amidohydrolase [Chloroflexota bacterium]MCH8869611.1 amidohydrolase [Chloroflexota bacterium]MCI0771420.1 amidohydrolase [Chloroflexota bacterium]MCI0822161.1 amidohydrolase [Chloroflexota bacterium]MCI0841518.1 amidohydrolase [Chloroflexota bacterium]
MRSIDIHAHITPEGYIRAAEKGEDWYGTEADAGAMFRNNPRTSWTPEQRLADMDSLGVDVHVLSTNAYFYNYDKDAATVTQMSREANDHVSQLTKDHPTRFAGLANLPMQDVGASVAELERSMTQLGLKGAMIGDHVNGKNYDDPEFLPLWKAAEELGAVMLVHQGGATVVNHLSTKYHLPNTIGNLADRTVTFSSFVFGGVMDKHPNLKICLSHGGGYTCFGIGRLDRGWQVRREARVNIHQPPSNYVRMFYYDCLTHDERALRMLIDTVGIDKVLFGTDWPFDMALDWPVAWILDMASLSQEEKEAILYRNLEDLLDI